jgi:hypothetical protein
LSLEGLQPGEWREVTEIERKYLDFCWEILQFLGLGRQRSKNMLSF